MSEALAEVLEARPRRFRPYPEYQDSGVESLGKIPGHWDVRRLKFTATIMMGQSPPSDLYNIHEEGPAFLQGNADFGSEYPTPQIYCPSPSRQAQPGDLLLSVRAPVGAINTADRPYGIGRGLCAIRPENGTLDLRFSRYAVDVASVQLNAEATGSTYDAVSTEDVSNISIPLSSIGEQRSAAAFLDRETAKIDALVARKKELIEMLHEKRTSLITRAVTKGLDPNVPMRDSGVEWLGEIPAHWGVKRLKRLFEVVNGSTPKSSEPDYWEGDIPWVTPDDLGKMNGSELSETRRSITRRGYESCGTSTVPVGSLVLSTRAPIGHLAMAGAPLCTNQGCRSLVFRGDHNRRFFYYQVRATRPVFEAIGRGSTFMELAKVDLESVSLCVPLEEEQLAITDFLDTETATIDALVDKVRDAIDRLKEFRTALIAAAVTGKIDVRGEVP